MRAISFNGVLIIAGIAVVVPVILGLLPRLTVPGAVLEVVADILVGPSVLGWVHIDAPIQVLSDLGLGMLLFLAGLEIDVQRLRGPLAQLAGWAFGASVVLALLCACAFRLGGQAAPPLLLAIVFMSTSAGLLLPLLKDADEETTRFGQLVMTAAALRVSRRSLAARIGAQTTTGVVDGTVVVADGSTIDSSRTSKAMPDRRLEHRSASTKIYGTTP